MARRENPVDAMEAGLRVAIVGGGVAGLASAVFMARAGHDVRVFERLPGIVPEGTGILLEPAGLDALRRMGLADAALALGSRITRIVARTSDGTERMHLRYADLRPDLHALGIRRPALASLLQDAARADGAHFQFGIAIGALRQQDGEVFLQERDTERHHGPFDLVIIGNGLRSRLRDSVIPGAQVRPHLRAVYSVILPLAAGMDAGTLLQRPLDNRDAIGLLPVGIHGDGQPRMSFFWHVHPDEIPQLHAAGFPAWCDYVESFCPEAHGPLRALGSFEALTWSTTAEITLRRWHEGPVVVIGDAAHALNPQLGLGATMALLDAECLDHCLRESRDLNVTLARFGQLRRPHVARYARVSAIWSRLDGTGFSPLRRWLFRGMATGPAFLRRRLLHHVCGYASHRLA
jgi:2-polyprenyl-6-methoxyphenol hydroxylase-like FAD-dependent oxidoreductase